MFIRWKRRPKAPTKPRRRPRFRSDKGDSLYCVVVESQRVDGKPRQKVVMYLGSLDEKDREKMWQRVDFWDLVGPKLDSLQLTKRQRTRIEESISVVVARVSDEEAAAFRLERARDLKELEALIELRNMFANLSRIFGRNR